MIGCSVVDVGVEVEVGAEVSWVAEGNNVDVSVLLVP